MAIPTPQPPGWRQVVAGLLLGACTCGWTVLGLVVADLVIIPASGCQELGCLAVYLIPLATVPVAVAMLVALLRFRRPVVTFVVFLAALVVLVRTGAVSRSDVLLDLLLVLGAGAFAGMVAGSLPRPRRSSGR